MKLDRTTNRRRVANSKTGGFTLGAALAAALISLLAPAIGFALASDRDQPIHIRSNSAERDDSKGITIYDGDVEMQQGSMQITANRVVIHNSGKDISLIIATGSPAQYQQTPDQGGQKITAKGLRIEYHLANDQVTLSREASLEQSDGTTLTGETINYDIGSAIVRANSGQGAQDRIYMVIPPKSDTDNTSE